MSKRVRNTLEVGTRVLNGRYEVLKVIHSKGMSAVYLVTDNNLHKQWCLKEIKKSDAGKDNVEYDALLQEANIMKGLNHASIPRITTIEEEGDSLFIVMDYVDGMSLKAWLAKKGKISQEIVVVWMQQIVQVMMYLHNRTQPIFYRDMKPDNVMIQGDGNIKVLDFGISLVLTEPDMKITRALGTKGYAAPEQSKRGNVCDLRSDIYALGKTMYYMLTGINPSQIPKEKQKPVREIDSSISLGLDEIVTRCTKEDPDERYQSCEELLYALQNYTKLDVSYLNSLKKKIYGVSAAFITSLVLIAGSFIPLNVYRHQQNDYYLRELEKAQTSTLVEDYLHVLDINSEKIEPYMGLVSAMKQDGIFTKDESIKFLEYITVNRQTLSVDPDYGELAYNVGKLYWFFYDGERDGEREVMSISWFNEAIKAGYKVEESTIYHQLGVFIRDIKTSVNEGSDTGMYKPYWDTLIEAKSSMSGELLSLQLDIAIAQCVSGYSSSLMRDGVSASEIISAVNEIKLGMATYIPSTSKAQELFDKLQFLMESVDIVLQFISKSNGGDING